MFECDIVAKGVGSRNDLSWQQDSLQKSAFSLRLRSFFIPPLLSEEEMMTQKKYTLSLVVGLLCSVPFLTGCSGKKEQASTSDTLSGKEAEAEKALVAFNDKDYALAQQIMMKYLNVYPDDEKAPSFRLMLADSLYEQESYPQAYVAYKDFHERFPAHDQAEYAMYKAAHAKFAQANHVMCDSTATEEAIEHCKTYLDRSDYNKYRRQMANLERTCQQRIIDKEFYIANNYMNQNKLASARKRLSDIEETFDLNSYNSKDKVLFYQAKLAQQEQKSEELAHCIERLHADHPRSHFTAMADRLGSSSFFG